MRCLLRAALVVGFFAFGCDFRPALAETNVRQDGKSWLLENAKLRVSVDPDAGSVTVLDKTAGRTWAPAGLRVAKYREATAIAQGVSLMFDHWAKKDVKVPLMFRLTLPSDGAALVVEIDAKDRTVEIGAVTPLDPLVLDSAKGVLVVPDYSNGHLYPLDQQPFPRGSFSGSRLDMPWLGLCDMASGASYAVILETSDDMQVHMRKVRAGQREVQVPLLMCQPCKKQLSYTRRWSYHFFAKGGYVAMAKCYRQFADRQGLIVPFAEKVKKNPNLAKLFGAPDVWGGAGLKFAREAKAAGVEKMLLQGRFKAEEMKEINALGYITSEYDNYTDALPVEQSKDKQIDSSHDRIPEHIVQRADGERMTAWLTWDKKKQYMKRCPALWVETAKQVVPKVLEKYPYLGRFIDVTTAEDLYECYDPKHPLTKAQKRQCGIDLLSYVRGQNLVMGGEHGIWWAVPQLDYVEGMMSGGYASWPAGHLLRPKSKSEEFIGTNGRKLPSWDDYARWGIGHEHRAPLWELVFHDCIVTTWYWGDASDFLLTAAPEITPKKDAFNVLYGSMPMMWANKEGSWTTNREAFLRTYRNTCKFHEAIAGVEMTGHEFVTPDRAVQRTTFADGTVAVVNFGSSPYRATVGGQTYELPQNGFVARGPKGEQSLALVGGKAVTKIHFGAYQHQE